MQSKKNITEILKKLPDKPGIYKMLDAESKVIYIGKAKSLKKRVKQYFQKNYQHSTRTKKLVENINDIKFITVDTELEAFILEHNQIKQFKPKYNILLKDDKSYVYIKISNEDFPRIRIVRNIEKDKATYIGPKTASHKVKETLKLLKKLFPFRHCNLDISLEKENEIPPHQVKVAKKLIKYPCLDYHIKRCSAPCIGKISKENYAEIIKSVKDFLQGRGDELLKNLKLEMLDLAEKKKFEKAAKLRDKILKVESILEKQKISNPNRKDTDIINYVIKRESAYFNLFQIRDGKLINQENFKLKAKDFEDNENSQEVLESFLIQYYEVSSDFPKEIIIPHEIENQKLIDNIFQEENKIFKATIPQKGEKDKLLKMSLNNAKIFADREKSSWQNQNEDNLNATKELQKILSIKKDLKRIECYDISHLSGTNTVASMVVFINGAPQKDLYRKFFLRNVQNEINDFKSLNEVLFRRLNKLKTPKNINIRKNKDLITLKEKEKILITAKIKEIDKNSSLILSIESKNPKAQKFETIFIENLIKKLKTEKIYLLNKSSKQFLETAKKLGFKEIKKLKKSLKDYKVNEIYLYDKKTKKVDKSFSQKPDLIIIDGGKGQLKEGTKVLKELDLDIPYISLAKREEEIFTAKSKAPIIVDKHNPALKLIQRLRDESHRFAITYQRSKRKITKNQ